MERVAERVISFDLAHTTVRALNQFLHHDLPQQVSDADEPPLIEVLNPDGRHNLAVGMTVPARIQIRGHAGYFIGGMNKLARITVQGNVGWSVAENIMSGEVRVQGCASECAAASGHGGLVIIEGDASSRCAISLKGTDVVVGGSVGHMSAFMAQAGRLVICGDAGPNLGDSLYEAVIYVRGRIHSLGTDARIEPLLPEDHQILDDLLHRVGLTHPVQSFQRVASARTLYHWHEGAAGHY